MEDRRNEATKGKMNERMDRSMNEWMNKEMKTCRGGYFGDEWMSTLPVERRVNKYMELCVNKYNKNELMIQRSLTKWAAATRNQLTKTSDFVFMADEHEIEVINE